MKTRLIRSDSLPPGLQREKWLSWAAGLWFFTHLLKSAWEEKFHDLGRLHYHLCRYLDPTVNPSQRKFISIFRGSYKTTILLAYCLYLFCWALVKGESISIVYNTATRENAEGFMDDFRQTLLRCHVLQWIFRLPQTPQGYDKWTKWKVHYKGARFQVSSLETRQVSRHFKVYINDDLVNDDNAFSDIERENVLRKWRLQKSILTKYKKRKIGMEIDVGTPFHHSDLIAHIIKNVKNYDKFIMPYKLRLDDGSEILTFPEMFTWEDFEEIRSDQGESLFATQYELRVLDDADRIATEKWIRKWVYLPEYYYRILIIDPAGTDNKKNDPTGFLVVDIDHLGYIYIIYSEHLWLAPYRMLKHAEALQQAFQPDETYVEKEKYSITIADTVEHLAPQFNFTFVEHRNQDPKERVHRLKQFFETGRILFGPGQEDLISEVLNYPACAHDDLIICLSYVPRVMIIPKKIERDRDTVQDKDFLAEINGVRDRLNNIEKRENMDAFF